MKKVVLITGGAGFIGSRLADELITHGYQVRALDNLSVQVHGSEGNPPSYLNPDTELIVGDVRDSVAVKKALKGVDAVYHFAAAVGVGQSMYEVEQYTSTNTQGTAVLLEALIDSPVERLIIASSMSVYGEGLYVAPDGAVIQGTERSLASLKSGEWDLFNDEGDILTPIPTPESKIPFLTSIYALSKYYQERSCMMIGNTYKIPTVALRFFNVFGSHQALSNPYTGVLAIFASSLINGNAPLIYEDGLQKRDFVSVHDVAKACRLALEVPEAAGHVINIGTGSAYTIRDIAERLARVVGKSNIEPCIPGKSRIGDIRNCFADISLAHSILGYEPSVTLDEGLSELANWLEGKMAHDRVMEAAEELASRGLTV
jgi:dTDP-L-rhamnose 4-epimerase